MSRPTKAFVMGCWVGLAVGLAILGVGHTKWLGVLAVLMSCISAELWVRRERRRQRHRQRGVTLRLAFRGDSLD